MTTFTRCRFLLVSAMSGDAARVDKMRAERSDLLPRWPNRLNIVQFDQYAARKHGRRYNVVPSSHSSSGWVTGLYSRGGFAPRHRVALGEPVTSPATSDAQ
jgi:hypothetical protein